MSLSLREQETLEHLWAITASETDAARERDERLLRQNNFDVQVSRESSTVPRVQDEPSRSVLTHLRLP